MSEINGQLLGLLALLLVFGATAATVSAAVIRDSSSISQKAEQIESSILPAR